MWDLLITAGDKKFAVETRTGDNRHSTSRLLPLPYLASGTKEENLNGGIAVTRLRQRGNYVSLKLISHEGRSFYLVTKWDRKTVESRIGKGWQVGR
jgi:hypothetical protein